jgi:diacylglycerol kinase family enzyme
MSGADRKELVARLRRAFNDVGDTAAVECVDAPTVLRQAKEATASDTNAIVVGGGDALVAEVVNLVAGSHKAVGVLPLGADNHFARELRLPLEIEPAAAALARGKIAEANVGEVNGRIFVNCCAIGLAADGTPDRVGFAAPLLQLLRLDDGRVRLRSRGHTLVRAAPNVIVCNNPHVMKQFGINASTSPEAGLLNVYVTRGAHRSHGVMGLLSLLAAPFTRKSAHFQKMSLPDVRIESRARELEVLIDGALWSMRPPLQCRIRPRPLRVLVPLDSPLPAVQNGGRASAPVVTELEGLELEPHTTPPAST